MGMKGSNPSPCAIVSVVNTVSDNPVETSNCYLRMRLLSSLFDWAKVFLY